MAYSLAFERHVSSVFTYGKAGGLEGKKAAEFFSRHMYTGRFHPQHVTGAVPGQSYFFGTVNTHGRPEIFLFEGDCAAVAGRFYIMAAVHAGQVVIAFTENFFSVSCFAGAEPEIGGFNNLAFPGHIHAFCLCRRRSYFGLFFFIAVFPEGFPATHIQIFLADIPGIDGVIIYGLSVFIGSHA